MGDVLMKAGRYEEAIASLRKANRVEQDDQAKQTLYKRISFCFNQQKLYPEAYKAGKKGIPVFETTTNFQDLYYLGKLAGRTGHREEAVMLFRMASIKVPMDDEPWKRRIKRLLKQLR